MRNFCLPRWSLFDHFPVLLYDEHLIANTPPRTVAGMQCYTALESTPLNSKTSFHPEHHPEVKRQAPVWEKILATCAIKKDSYVELKKKSSNKSITNNKIILKDNSEGKMARDLNTYFTE